MHTVTSFLDLWGDSRDSFDPSLIHILTVWIRLYIFWNICTLFSPCCTAPENSSRCSDHLVMVLTLAFNSLALVVAYFTSSPWSADVSLTHSLLSWLRTWNRWLFTASTSHAHRLVLSHLGWIRRPYICGITSLSHWHALHSACSTCLLAINFFVSTAFNNNFNTRQGLSSTRLWHRLFWRFRTFVAFCTTGT